MYVKRISQLYAHHRQQFACKTLQQFVLFLWLLSGSASWERAECVCVWVRTGKALTKGTITAILWCVHCSVSLRIYYTGWTWLNGYTVFTMMHKTAILLDLLFQYKKNIHSNGLKEEVSWTVCSRSWVPVSILALISALSRLYQLYIKIKQFYHSFFFFYLDLKICLHKT